MTRIRTLEAAEMLGLTARGVQAMAAKGQLPGAAKIGKVWTFDKDKLRRFIEAKEAECASQIFTKGKASIGCAPRSTASCIEKAYEQAMSKLRGGPATRGLRRSRGRQT